MERNIRKQGGFTLIELMIVVAIIGILAAAAIPAYQDYTAKAKISTIMSIAAGSKTPFYEYYSENGEMPADGTTANTLGKQILDMFLNSVYTAAGTTYTRGNYDPDATGAVNNQVTIHVLFEGVDGTVNGKSMDFVYRVSGIGMELDCTGGDLEDKYKPKQCQ